VTFSSLIIPAFDHDTILLKGFQVPDQMGLCRDDTKSSPASMTAERIPFALIALIKKN
jgi:hypothetical protein